eukprot:1141038-Pelagomonas_calceolata.AAC.10
MAVCTDFEHMCNWWCAIVEVSIRVPACTIFEGLSLLAEMLLVGPRVPEFPGKNLNSQHVQDTIYL